MLDFDAATKRFGSLTALDGCTFAAQPGRLTGFLVPNEAGKTTAMRGRDPGKAFFAPGSYGGVHDVA